MKGWSGHEYEHLLAKEEDLYMEKALALYDSSPYIAAAVWLLGSVICAFFIRILTTQALSRLTSKTRTEIDDHILAALGRPMFATVVLIGIHVTIVQFTPSASVDYVSQAILLTIGVLLWAVAGNRIGHTVLGALAKRIDHYKFVQPRTLPLFDIALNAIIYGGAAYGILLAWEVDVTAWLASAGILGIAIGFAAKDTLANLFSGIFILADAPYKIGDFIILDSGERGLVTDIGIRSTRLLTRDDIEIILPNAAIANTKIVNESGGPHKKERVRVTVGVAYGSDIDVVRDALNQVARESKYLADDPAPRVRFREFGESALKFQLMGWIDEPVLRGRALDELNTGVYNRFAQRGIQIAFPQLDVHFKGNCVEANERSMQK